MKPYFEGRCVSLYLGDMRDVLPQLELEGAVTLTDPPYNAKKRYGVQTNDARPWPEWCAWWDGCLDVLRSSSRDVFAFLSQTAHRHYLRLGQIEPDWTLVWNKPLALAVCALPFMPHWEPIGYWGETRKRDGAFWGSDVLSCNVTPNVFNHPTEKPLALLREMVRRYTNPGDLVLDGFAGSGTSLVAAQIEGRRAVGVEIEEEYAEIIARRLELGEAAAQRPQQGVLALDMEAS